jgi:hypothetical protein
MYIWKQWKKPKTRVYALINLEYQNSRLMNEEILDWVIGELPEARFSAELLIAKDSHRQDIMIFLHNTSLCAKWNVIM